MTKPEDVPNERTQQEARVGWAHRRREEIVAEIARNRRGDYKVPTWVLVVILVVFVAAWATLIAFA